ncbi:aminoglycoside phosphotransferase family protein [Rhodoferax sp.]|uniref:aminoglycoside phosphotransferase family protein n=1 Tax=Rhodoferax sp. TaxID=50421 RepID=UPI00374CBD56
MSPTSPPASAASLPVSATICWADAQREAVFHAWLARVAAERGLLPASLHLASADASFRRYFRIATAAGGSYIIMDAPPDKENNAAFVKIGALMAQAGLRVPEVLEWEQTHGFLLLSDLGTQTMINLVSADAPQAAVPLYHQAVDTLITWQLQSKPDVLPPYDAAVLNRELNLFPDWYIAQHRGITLDATQRASLDSVFAQIVANNLAMPSVYVHRDFMARNLMVGGEQLGVLDFQDGLYGPITYDIAALLRDAFLTWEEDFVLDITIRYWERARKAGLPVGDDFGAFYRSVEWMGLQRHLKIAGLFTRLTLRDGKPKYLADVPRFIAYIRATAGRYRELTPLLRLVDKIEGTTAATGFAYGRM